jgi:hypothetical protein
MKMMKLMLVLLLLLLHHSIAQQQDQSASARPLCTSLSNPYRLNLPIVEPRALCGLCARPDECAAVGGRLAEVAVGCEDVQEIDRSYACCTNRLKDDDACGCWLSAHSQTRAPPSAIRILRRLRFCSQRLLRWIRLRAIGVPSKRCGDARNFFFFFFFF